MSKLDDLRATARAVMESKLPKMETGNDRRSWEDPELHPMDLDAIKAGMISVLGSDVKMKQVEAGGGHPKGAGYMFPFEKRDQVFLVYGTDGIFYVDRGTDLGPIGVHKIVSVLKKLAVDSRHMKFFG